jgi:hypothetical protein
VNIGAVPMVMLPEANMVVPEGLLHGGHHFDDISGNSRQTCQSLSVQLPHDKMHEFVLLQRHCSVQNLACDIENTQQLIVSNIK